jgi:hypothetical protein
LNAWLGRARRWRSSLRTRKNSLVSSAQGWPVLRNASNAANSLEGRFDLAYNAAHAFCLAALRYHGFRPGNRYIVFQVLPHTVGLGPKVWRVLAKCHEIRNLGEYEGDLNIDERIVTDLIVACRAVAAKLDALPALA